MKERVRRAGSREGFTLIELLIVVAIIAILALIAVPNFLEAQARAKVARAMNDMRALFTAVQAYQIDWNGDVIWDSNDPWTPQRLRTPQWSWRVEHPGEVADMRFIGGDWMMTFYAFAYFQPLTTPTAYITYHATDPFSRNVPVGLDTREIGGAIVYWVLLCGGPDKDDGDWFRGNNNNTVDRNRAVKYDPTNGTISNGDIWRGEALADKRVFDQEYGTNM